MGKAAMMDTVCRLFMEFSEKIRAMGRSISVTAQKSLMKPCRFLFLIQRTVGVGGSDHG